MPSWAEVLRDEPIGGEEPLRVSWGLEADFLALVLHTLDLEPFLCCYHLGQFVPVDQDHNLLIKRFFSHLSFPPKKRKKVFRRRAVGMWSTA
jgi:hypothetical protein